MATQKLSRLAVDHQVDQRDSPPVGTVKMHVTLPPWVLSRCKSSNRNGELRAICAKIERRYLLKYANESVEFGRSCAVVGNASSAHIAFCTVVLPEESFAMAAGEATADAKSATTRAAHQVFLNTAIGFCGTRVCVLLGTMWVPWYSGPVS